jgi:hypothetical protein
VLLQSLVRSIDCGGRLDDLELKIDRESLVYLRLEWSCGAGDGDAMTEDNKKQKL